MQRRLGIRRVLAIALSALALGAPASACTRAELRSTVDASLNAWIRHDLDAFRAAREQVTSTLSCQHEIVPRDLARDLHLSAALAAYLPPRDPDAVTRAFRAALAADPAYALPESLAPPGNLLHDLLDAARLPAGDVTLEAAGAPEGCRLLVDGWEGEQRPVGRPSLVQQECAGLAGPIALLPAQAPLPPWAAAVDRAELAQTDSLPVESAPPGRRGLRRGLGIGGGVALLGAGGLYLGATSARSSYRGLTDEIGAGSLGAAEEATVDSKRAQANALGYGAQAGAIVGVGLLGTALLVRW